MKTQPKNGKGPAKRVVVRCAIYTRKSNDEGLQQEFNSLDAQREACEAYIVSQKHEGWTLVPERYDDGGFSGATMERPALRRLLADVTSGIIDAILVYRLDRISRFLPDFARINETLDHHDCALVSVTEQFSTATPAGRLHLNMLMSFSQHEREVIAERTRDKMSAARRRGRWTGGVPLLGYDIDPKGGKIHVNKAEAKRVRTIFQLYVEKQSVLATVQELNRRGWTTKSWTTRHGTLRPGSAWSKNTLLTLLKNRLYLGEVEFQGQVYPGEHEGIVDFPVWEQAQAILRRNGQTSGSAVRNKYGALLPGLLHCAACGSRMTSTHTKKKERRYRYYVCSRVMKLGRDACPTPALPASEIERFVVERIKCIGKDPAVIAQVRAQTPPPHDGLEEALAEFYTLWDALTSHEQVRVVQLIVERVTYDAPAGTIEFAFRPTGIRTLLEEIPQ